MYKLMNSFILLYIPVFHEGYLDFLEKLIKTQNITQLWLIDPDWASKLTDELKYLRKDIRSLKPGIAKNLLSKLYPQLSISILNKKTLNSLTDLQTSNVFAPDEDVSRLVAKKFFTHTKIELLPVFLRWDKKRVRDEQKVKFSGQISVDKLEQEIMTKAFHLAGNSNDWWRHVGALLMDKGKIVSQAFNHHSPTPQTQYILGDPRALEKSGSAIEVSTSVHAEGAVIAEAARKGIKTEGLDLFVTTFPCPYCARLIVGTGIARLYFTEGYNQLESQQLLEGAGVKIIQVRLDKKTLETQNRATIVKAYPAT